jgi:16S rRNA (cytosine1402-N4)-methyltransferase
MDLRRMHIPVLLQEVIDVLKVAPGDFVIDGTLGAGGHARALIERIVPNGMFLGVDRDQRAVNEFSSKRDQFAGALKYVQVFSTSYANLSQLLVRESLPKADALLVDLGFSSEQIDGAFVGRGFSFMRDEPLIMTYDDAVTPLRDVLPTLSVEELTKIITEYGDERYAYKIAKAIDAAQKQKPITTSGQLASVVKEVLPKGYEHGRIHPATRTFQALRIYVNRELEQLKELLVSLPQIVKPGGRVAVITFHSLEDRIVKHYFKDGVFLDQSLPAHIPGEESEGSDQSVSKVEQFSLITKKPITASEAELASNPRARSAKLRAVIVN